MKRVTLVQKLRRNFEYRRDYVRAGLASKITATMRELRKRQKWTQEQTAAQCGKHASVVYRQEQPDYNRHSIRSLVTLAAAYGLALKVEFIPLSEFLVYESSPVVLPPAANSTAELAALREWVEAEGGESTVSEPENVIMTAAEIAEIIDVPVEVGDTAQTVKEKIEAALKVRQQTDAMMLDA